MDSGQGDNHEKSWPDLHADIARADDTDIDSLWDRFEIFEALHHEMTIDNPMTSADLDEVVEMLSPSNGDHSLDIACGHGELLRRIRRAAAVSATGVDLSPWMLRTAHELAQQESLDISWELAEGKDYANDRTFDLATCLGGSWIWHGFGGTVRALAQRANPSGRIAIGDMHLRDGLDAAAVTESHGAVESIDELESHFDAHGLDIVGRVNTSDEAWDDYLARTRSSVESWARLHPGERSNSYLADQQRWQDDHARDREILTWSVWVAKKR